MTNLKTLNNELDRIFDHLTSRSVGYDYLPTFLEDFGKKVPAMGNYPPYDIIKESDNKYAIKVALAGYSPSDIDVSVDNDRLFIKTNEPKKTLTSAGAETETIMDTFIYKGIAKRSFNLSYALGEHMNVTNATFENGLLVVNLEREIPEEKKPRQIPIMGKNVEMPAIEEKVAA